MRLSRFLLLLFVTGTAEIGFAFFGIVCSDSSQKVGLYASLFQSTKDAPFVRLGVLADWNVGWNLLLTHI